MYGDVNYASRSWVDTPLAGEVRLPFPTSGWPTVTATQARTTATALSAGVLSVGAVTVLPPLVAVVVSIVIAIVLVHTLLPARPATTHHRSTV